MGGYIGSGVCRNRRYMEHYIPPYIIHCNFVRVFSLDGLRCSQFFESRTIIIQTQMQRTFSFAAFLRLIRGRLRRWLLARTIFLPPSVMI